MSRTDDTVAAESAATQRQEALERGLIDEVVASFEQAEDARLKQLMQALTRHLHAYLREVRLTDAEWMRAIEFLAAAGDITDEKRQEFILLSDALGASMQTVAMNNEIFANATEATVFGPFFVDDAPQVELGGDIARGAPGQPCWVEGSVLGIDGTPIRGARIEVWEADEKGFYDVQYADDRNAGRAHLFSDDAGRFRFWGITPTPYPIPDDGPVGKMLTATGRSPMRPAHLHFMINAAGWRTLVTHIFVEGDEILATGDSVFGVKQSLIKRFETQPVGTPTPDGRELGDRSWARTRFDIVLAPQSTEATHRRNRRPGL